MLKNNTQLIIGAVSIAFALGLATSRVGSVTSLDAAMAKNTMEPAQRVASQQEFEYFPAQFVNKGKEMEVQIPQFLK